MLEAGPLQFLTEAETRALFRPQEIRTAFYSAFRELTDQKGLPSSPGVFGGERVLLRGRQVLEDVLLPELNKKGSKPEEQIATIPNSAIVLAVYAAAAQQTTRLFGRTARAREMFRALRHSRFETMGLKAMGATIAKPGLLDRPETLDYVKQVRGDLTQTLRLMG